MHERVFCSPYAVRSRNAVYDRESSSLRKRVALLPEDFLIPILVSFPSPEVTYVFLISTAKKCNNKST